MRFIRFALLAPFLALPVAMFATILARCAESSTIPSIDPWKTPW